MSDRLHAAISASLIAIKDKLVGELPTFPALVNTQAEGQFPTSVPPEDVPLTTVDRFRYPIEVATDSYLDDPIRFEVSRDFYKDAIPLQLPEGSVEYERDIAAFVVVETNRPSDEDRQYHMISTFSDIYNRIDFYRTINVEFEEF